MRYLSVCSGIEAASVAWHPLGWQPLAFSEIEPFPRAVLAHHYPNVPLHGDFTKLREQPWIVDADVLVGGTPCQAFSVAGLRNSLSDDRGNLTLEFLRLADAIDDARHADKRDPAIIVWENVPGVLSVRDNAFGCFLAALAGDDSPYIPPRGKWTNAGVVIGPRRAIAWRILDAQYFGLAQRRRRVFVVASARAGFDPAEVLFEFEGVQRHTAPSREAGQGTAHATAPCLTSSGRGVERTGDPRGQDPVVAVNWPAASTGEVSHCLNAGGMGRQDYETETLIAHTLKAEGFDASEDGTGRGTPLVPVPYSIMPQNSGVDVAQPVMAGGPVSGNQGGDYILQPVAFHVNAQADQLPSAGRDTSVSDTLTISQSAGVAADLAVRRLTPVECARLQGFPDDYLTSVTWRGKCPPPDGPMYKALGNPMAVSVMRWIGRRIASELAVSQIPHMEPAA